MVKIDHYPAAHIEHLDRMKADGWDVEDERTRSVWLQESIGSQMRRDPLQQD
ncbi:hypothetical protein WMF11_22430 [Sorangium sp. So ce295]|uniref:hypothetical protein n=1 Tax=Sorangium sp. So ce295 TaxID=3133295 RepID=UPI003F5DD9B6